MRKRKPEIVNGVEVGRGWGAFLRRSQKNPCYVIDGKPMPRVRYGADDPEGEVVPPCRDCAAARGQFHVPGCCIEDCPKCGRQAIGCECFCPFTVDFSPFYVVGEEVEE